ncbi:ATP-binding protein [Acinetobacter larvae]|uniref:DNA replication protein n=1 Tax=Acinetobacter larvae TaxID=1789224 RepID=A0A1B2LZE2_9GAMM|nr:ATP-binding protein [Acinetobacter larvae]AOA58306.1 DNA replication protein [Acinetobacter larvae]
MNAISLINQGFQQTQEYCATHQVAKVQAGSHQICPKCAVIEVESNNRNRQAEIDRMVREKHFSGAMLPVRHADSGFKNYIINPNNLGQANARSQCVNYTKSIAAGVKSNLIMVGSTGTGKTHLAVATARTLLNKGMFVRYITSEELAQRIMNAWDRDSKGQSEESIIHDFTQYHLLILDEYGLHDREKRLELVHKVLYARYDAGKPTMLISNFTMADLQKDLGDRLWSRFQHDGLTVVECNWADQRVGEVA